MSSDNYTNLIARLRMDSGNSLQPLMTQAADALESVVRDRNEAEQVNDELRATCIRHDAEWRAKCQQSDAVILKAIDRAHTTPNLWDRIESRDEFLAILEPRAAAIREEEN